MRGTLTTETLDKEQNKREQVKQSGVVVSFTWSCRGAGVGNAVAELAPLQQTQRQLNSRTHRSLGGRLV